MESQPFDRVKSWKETGTIFGVAIVIVLLIISISYGCKQSNLSEIVLTVTVQGPLSTIELNDGSYIETYKVTVGYLHWGNGANQGAAIVRLTPDMTEAEKSDAIAIEAKNIANALGWSHNPLEVRFR